MSNQSERQDPDSSDGKSAGAVSRRGLIAKGAGAAAAGLGLVALATDPAHAAAGDSIILGQVNNAGSGATDLVSTNTWAFRVVNNNTGGVGVEARGHSVGVAGISPDSGDAATDLGTGLIGEGSYGIQAIGRRVGLRAAGPVPLHLDTANSDGPPTVGSHIIGDVYTDARGHVFVCAAEGAPGTWVQPGFNPVNPFRVADTRAGGGTPYSSGHTLDQGQEIEVAFWGVGGVVSGATAVICNLTVTVPTAIGYLTVYPNGAARPTTSNINFLPGQTIANQMTVKLGPDGKVKVSNASGSVHFIVDLAGFFY